MITAVFEILVRQEQDHFRAIPVPKAGQGTESILHGDPAQAAADCYQRVVGHLPANHELRFLHLDRILPLPGKIEVKFVHRYRATVFVFESGSAAVPAAPLELGRKKIPEQLPGVH